MFNCYDLRREENMELVVCGGRNGTKTTPKTN